MAKPAKEAVEINDFPGLATRIDPDDTRPGTAQDQVNLSSLVLGQLRSRPGVKVVTFEEE